MYIATPWDWHVRMAVCAMQNGKHAAIEVPAAITLDECWQFPDTVADTAAVWSGGTDLRVQGISGQYETPRGALSQVKVGSLDDIVPVKSDPAEETLFPDGLPNRRWIRFPARGLEKPACGAIYRSGDRVTNGMALGGIDTGCLDLETNGLLGYCTVFNTHIPRRGRMNLPVLGMSVGGKTWGCANPSLSRERVARRSPWSPC